MYSLSVTLIGCQDSLQRNVLSMLINQKASLDAQYDDVESAITALRDDVSGAPRLFIMHVPDSAMLPHLRQLVGVFVGRPVLALVDAMMDPSVLLGAMRSGAAQVVPLPIQPEDFRAAMDCIAQQYGHSQSSQAICISGVTGGCGATALAVNIAYEIATQLGQHVILSELSLQIGKLSAYLDVNPEHTTFDLLNDGERVDPQMIQRALTRITDRLDVLAGEYRAITPVSASSASIIRLVDYCRSLSNVALFDVPCTYDDLYFETLAVADQVVLVGEQKIPSIRTLKLVCEALSRIDGARKLHIIINRYDPRMPGFGAERLKSLLDVEGVLTVCNDYAAVMASINHGRPLRQEAPRSAALSDINRVVQTLLSDSEQPAGAGAGKKAGVNGKSGIGKLFKRFGIST
jgi:pilus assembly protein CpaE